MSRPKFLMSLGNASAPPHNLMLSGRPFFLPSFVISPIVADVASAAEACGRFLSVRA